YREDKIMAVSRTFDTARLCRNIALYGLGSVILFVWVVPIAWAVIVSFKSTSEVLAYPPQLIFDPTLTNYRDAVAGGFSIIPSFIDSLVLATTTTILTIILAVPAAYAFARLRLPWKKPLGFYTLATQMTPPIGLIIPYFLILNGFGWLDTY